MMKCIKSWLLGLNSKAPRIVLTCILGLSAGCAAVAFQYLSDWIFGNTISRFALLDIGSFALYSLLCILTVSCIAGWLMSAFGKDAAGSGIPQTKAAFWREFGHIPNRVAFIKFFAGSLSVGGGLSLGREGPSVQVGAGVASWISGLLGIPKHKKREACAAGAAAGLAAAFNTPIAAITFVLEEIVDDMNNRIMSSVVLAGIMGALAVLALKGPQPSFQIIFHPQFSWLSLVMAPVVAIAASLVAVGFQGATLNLRTYFRNQKGVSPWLKPALGGLVVWFCGLLVFIVFKKLGVFGLGYGDLTAALFGEISLKIGLALLIAKFISTAFVYGSGGCGGIFAPSLFLGAMTGLVVAQVLHFFIPSLDKSDLLILMLVGMCASLCSLVRAPFTSILILFEMTHEFSIVPALMVATLIAMSLSKSILREGFYEKVLLQDGVDLSKNTLSTNFSKWRETEVGSIANSSPICVTHTDRESVKSLISEYPYQYFPVIENGVFSGVTSRKSLEQFTEKGSPIHLRKSKWISPSSGIEQAEKFFIESDVDFLCIGDPEKKRLEGILTLHDLLRLRINSGLE